MGFGNFFKKTETIPTKSEEEIKQEQLQIGGQIKEAIKQAASSNKEFNLLNGKPVENFERINVGVIEENGKRYTIVPQVIDNESNDNKTILQIDVDLSQPGQELHTYSPFAGDDSYYSKEQLDEFTERVSNHVANYKIYKE